MFFDGSRQGAPDYGVADHHVVLAPPTAPQGDRYHFLTNKELQRLNRGAAPAHQEVLKMLAAFTPGEDRSWDPPPLPDRRATHAPAMLQALRNNELNEVRSVLQELKYALYGDGFNQTGMQNYNFCFPTLFWKNR